MKRLFLTLAGVCLLCTASILSAQAPTSGNITATVAAPNSVECSAPFNTSITLSGFDVQDPGVADIVFVLDESGSIPPASFAQMKTFMTNMINALMPATGGGARVGIAMFSSNGRRISNLTDIRQNAVNAVNSITQRGGNTCIGCGITEGRNIFAISPPRPEATQFMVVLTDGQNTVDVPQFPGIVQNAHNAGITLLAIGVGPSVDVAEINFIASDLGVVQTAFLTPDFAQLSTIVNSLTAAITSPGATNVTVDIDVQPRFPVSVSGATASAGAVTVMGSTVVWTLPSLGSGAQTLTLNHQHDGTGNGPLQIFTADYLDAEGHMVAIATPSTTVTGCNTAPVANAGADQDIALSGTNTASVTLDGSASTDDGLIAPLTYSWASSGGTTAMGVSPTLLLPFGVHEFTLTVSDGEFSDTDAVIVAVGDPSPPLVTSAVAGTLGANGWYTSNVTVSFTASDPESGVASTNGCDTATVAADTVSQTFTCTATNGAGLEGSAAETVKRDATAPSLTVSGPVTAEAASAAGAMVTYPDPMASDDTSGLAGASCSPASGSLFPQGETAVGCTATDHAGNTTQAGFTVTVRDTTAPSVDNVTPSAASLWPPNHRMVSVTVSASATDGVSPATCTISSVTSSEPDNGLGDGDTANDVVITGALSVDLRAERAGGGPGRVYTINVACTDAAGNTATSATMVTVPKSAGR
jgi:uncharacterized protein YegL